MAEFTDQDKELLDKLRKMFEATGKTRSQLEPWEEHLGRDTSVNTNRAALTAKILEGFSGSWAAQYNYGDSALIQQSGNPTVRPLTEPDPLGPPVPVRAKESKLGKRGVPEIGFAPYNWRTNTFGSKGPSLVGHPISFEVIGPTLKSPFMDWTWQVHEGAGIGGGDKLIMDVRPDGTANVMEPYAADITFAYGPGIVGPWVIGDDPEPNGGLYVIISDDGVNAGAIPAGRTPMGALVLTIDTARFEVFRIASIPVVGAAAPFEIDLHPNKRLSSYFDLPLASITRSVRAITIFKPYVTRLAAVPQSGVAGGSDGASTSGREQTFVVLSPERAASPDTYPPFDGGTPGDGTWLRGGFTESRAPGSSAAVGDPAIYGGKVRLPIPKPVVEVLANTGAGALFPTDPVGDWFISTMSPAFTAPPFSPSNLPIVNIFTTARDDDLPDLTFGSVESALGWFDVFGTEAGPRTGANLFRVNETDPVTGLTYFGPGPYVMDGAVPVPNLALGMTLHPSVSTLFAGRFDLDGVDAGRLKNLIDPNWVSRSEKQISDPLLIGGGPPPPGGASAGVSDKAIFDTRSAVPPLGGLREAANPGNLMDLGFRMVLFPAKPDPNSVTLTIPDFDRPIFGRELVIDGSVNEKQYVDIDYSSGIVRLSHAPPTSVGTVPGETTDVIPTGISGTAGNNTRGEVVLYGACVPYSMEEDQRGSGARITSHIGKDGRDLDVSSEQTIAAIDTGNMTFVAGTPFIGPSAVAPFPVEIILDRLWNGPETGVVTISGGNDDSPPFGRFGYSGTRVVTASPIIGPVTALQNITAYPAATNPDPALFPVPLEPRSVVLRREVVFGEESFSLPSLNDTYVSDTTYGSQIRAGTLRFEDAELQHNQDGSVTVVPRSPGYVWNQHGSWMASGIIDIGSGDDRLDAQGILAGVYYQDQTTTSGPSNGATAQDRDGQFTRFLSGGVAGDYTAVISRKSQINLMHAFRLVVKFRFLENIATDFAGFVGLVGPRNAFEPPAISVSVQTLLPIPASGFSMLGLRVFGAFPGTVGDFFTQDHLNPGSLSRSTGVVIPTTLGAEDRPFYLVIENTPFRDSALFNENGSFVKMALFDAEFNELSRTRFYNQNQVPGNTAMELMGGTRNTVGDGGIRFFDLYSAVIVNHTELPFKAIP